MHGFWEFSDGRWHFLRALVAPPQMNSKSIVLKLRLQSTSCISPTGWAQLEIHLFMKG